MSIYAYYFWLLATCDSLNSYLVALFYCIKRRYINVQLSQAKCYLSRSHAYKAPVSKTKPYLWITMANIGYFINALKANVVEVLVCINNKGFSPLQSCQCNIRPGSLILHQSRSMKKADIVSLKCMFGCWNSCYYLSFAI